MKNNVARIIALICLLTTCIALMGCADTSKYKENFVGDWVIESMEDAKLGSVDINRLKEKGNTVTLKLSEDDKASLNMFGQVEEGTWKVKIASEITLTLAEGEPQEIKLADERLTIEENGTKMVFVKGTP